MNWINLGSGAVIGATSGILASLLARRLTSKRYVSLTVFVLSFILFGFLSKQFLIPVIHAWKVEREVERSLSEISAFQHIAKYDPQAYHRIKTELVDSIRKGESQEQAVGRARQAVGGLVMRYIPHASDEAVVRYVRAMTLEIEELAEKNPQVCYRFLFPDRYGSADVTQYMKADTQRADLAALAEVIRTAAEQPQPAPNGETGDALLKKLMNNFHASQGDDAYLLQDPFAPGVDKKKVSKLIASLYREALNLPQEESGLLLRHMLSAKSP
jgi:hypothetical protein